MKKILFLTATALFSINTAYAAFTIPNVTVEDINSSASIYNYEVTSKCFRCGGTVGGVLVTDLYKTEDFYVPYFSDAGITSIGSPTNWSYSIETSNDLFELGAGAGVIHWKALGENNGINTTGSLDGFSYSSIIEGSVKAPFRTLFANGSSINGDPAIPASPSAIAAGLTPIATVPAPAATWLFGSGLLNILGFRKSKYKANS